MEINGQVIKIRLLSFQNKNKGKLFMLIIKRLSKKILQYSIDVLKK